MANDLVVQLGAKLDQFASDMSQAGDIADSAVSRIEQSFASLNPGINTAAIEAGFALLAGGAAAAVALVVSLNKSLSDTADEAERTGLSLERIQQLKFGANALGVGDSDFSASLDKFVTNLENAKSKSNDLLRVFQANGVAITDGNGKLKDTNQLITSAVDIIKRAPSIQDALQIGSFLGLSKQFAQSIFDAGDGFLQLASQANAAGAVIDDATIKKAQQFTEEWTKASAIWSAQLRGALGDVLPLLNDAVSSATAVINAVKEAYNFISAIKDFAIAPNIDTASVNQLQTLLKQYEDIKSTLDQGNKLNPTQLFEGSNIQVDGQITAQSAQDAIDKIKSKIDSANKSLPHVVIQSSPSVNPGIKDDTKDAYDRATESVEKYTARLQAEADAQGLGSAALEEFKAQALLTTAAQQAGLPITQKMANEIQDLAQDAGLAAEALEKAKVATTISRGQQTSLLSPEDVAIANQLKGLYPDVATALGSVEAQSLRTNQALSAMSSQISNDLTSNLTDIATGSVTAAQGFSNMTASILKDIEQMIIKIAIVEPLMRTLQSTIGGGLGGLSGLFGGGGGVASTISVGDQVFPAFKAAGGYISGPGTSTSDSIPARLSNGEYVINADAASKHRSLLDAINNGSQGFATGGIVGAPGVQQVSPRVGGGSQIAFGDINIQVPEGTDPTNAAAIAASVKSSMVQVVDERLRYHTRQRGMLG